MNLCVFMTINKNIILFLIQKLVFKDEKSLHSQFSSFIFYINLTTLIPSSTHIFFVHTLLLMSSIHTHLFFF